MGDKTLPLFAYAPTPEKFRRAKGEPRDYAAEWRAFVESNGDAAAMVRDIALVALMDGAERVSVGGIFETVRFERRVSLNHSWRAAAADWLIAQEPRLAGVIERRKRRTTK